MSEYQLKFKAYLKSLGSRVPSPGGGSALALVFCLGVSLVEKALNFSLKLKNPQITQKQTNKLIKAKINKLIKMRGKVSAYIDLDGELFSKIMINQGKKRENYLLLSEKLIVELADQAIVLRKLSKEMEFAIKSGIMSDFHIGIDCARIVLSGCILNLEANKKLFKTKNKNISIFKGYLKKWQ